MGLVVFGGVITDRVEVGVPQVVGPTDNSGSVHLPPSGVPRGCPGDQDAMCPGDQDAMPQGIRTFRQRTFRQPTLRQRTFRQRTFRQRTFRQNGQGGHFANFIFFSSKLRSYYHKPHDNDSTKVLYNKISNTLVLCRCISLESSCTTYI